MATKKVNPIIRAQKIEDRSALRKARAKAKGVFPVPPR